MKNGAGEEYVVVTKKCNQGGGVAVEVTCESGEWDVTHNKRSVEIILVTPLAGTWFNRK
jgi:hypothetical protein